MVSICLTLLWVKGRNIHKHTSKKNELVFGNEICEKFMSATDA